MTHLINVSTRLIRVATAPQLIVNSKSPMFLIPRGITGRTCQLMISALQNETNRLNELSERLTLPSSFLQVR